MLVDMGAYQPVNCPFSFWFQGLSIVTCARCTGSVMVVDGRGW